MTWMNLRVVLVLFVFAGMAGCDLDLQDPNRPTEEEVFAGQEGIRQVAIGLQGSFANQIVDPVYVVGLVTDEIGAGAATFQNFQQADVGGELDPATDVSVAPWNGHYEVIFLANRLLEAVPNAGFTPGTTSGILALARLYKAMALGNLIQLYERIPIEVGPDNPQPEFVDRAAVLTEILRLLQEARTQVQGTPPSENFNQQILAPGFDLPNTINAMLARYALIAGDQALALSAAAAVNPAVLSVIQYSATDPNALYNLWYASGNAFQMRPEQDFRLEAEAGDQRVGYWVLADTIIGANARLDDFNKYRTAPEPFPIYLPDEMRLIRAEVAARQGDLATARMLVNEVRTQCTSAVAEPTACLPALSDAELATQEDVLAEILRQRRYELFLQGVRYEDLRRFGVPLKYMWIPYPQTECDRNPNAPRGTAPWLCS